MNGMTARPGAPQWGGRASLLRWCMGTGFARHAGVSVDMTGPCALPGKDIEYLPGVKTQIDGRDMTGDEQAKARQLLEQMAGDARNALSGMSGAGK